MGRVIDITGQRFGRLKVIGRRYLNTKDRHTRWLCKCECGIERIVDKSSLISGKTRSCGCLRKGRAGKPRLGYGVANMRRTIEGYKRHAKKRGLEWSLTEERFKEIAQKDCYYCGAKPNNIRKAHGYNGDYIYNGIDRVDNIKGYIIDNIVPCCKTCNLAKNNLTLQEFKDWIKRLIINYKEWNNG